MLFPFGWRTGKWDLRFVRVAAKYQGDVADGAHQFRVKLLTDLRDHLSARFAIDRVEPHFKQLMMCERRIRLRQNGIGKTGLANDDHRFEMMPQLTQLPLLLPR